MLVAVGEDVCCRLGLANTPQYPPPLTSPLQCYTSGQYLSVCPFLFLGLMHIDGIFNGYEQG
jgi:hypothetical protein